MNVMKAIALKIGCALILLMLSPLGCNKQDASPPPAARPPSPVGVAIAISRDVPVYMDEVGRCVPFELVNIQPLVAGTIVSIDFTDGAEVNRGDLLFTIDPRPFQAALQQAKAT